MVNQILKIMKNAFVIDKKRSHTLLLALFFCAHVCAAVEFDLIKSNRGATIHYKGSENVVQVALQMLIADSRLVCEHPFSVVEVYEHRSIIVGVIRHDREFDELLSRYDVNASDISGKWEAFKIQVVEDQGNRYLFVVGSDPRGAAYGLLELSRRIGISPWVWWADVVPEKRENVTISEEQIIQFPSVQYRGVFLNDEDWALMPWSTKTHEPTSTPGAIGSKTYARIFELLLRLRANTIWPAMHECTIPFYLVEGNKDAAEKYGIVVATSHAEPMMRTNTGEWDREKYGDFNYFNNRDRVLTYWEERVKQLVHSENIYTVGMRGIHDGRMQGVSSVDDETRILHDVIDAQRNLLKTYNASIPLSAIPQAFIPYKEVLNAYNNGLRLPDDVTLVWCDDNNGYIMRLSDEEERKRSGGAGVYYHISYWGKPHDYLWLASTQPALIYTEMKRAWDYGSRRYWILNVGDIKPGEYLIEFFLDMAWDIESITPNAIYQHQKVWLKTAFGEDHVHSLNDIMSQYYRLGSQRKPEHMGWNKVEDYSNRDLLTNDYTRRYGLPPVKDTELSPFHFGDEISSRIDAYNRISRMSDSIYNLIPRHLKAAYFQLVHYPVKAAAAMNRKILYAQNARLYARYKLPVAAEYSRKATQAYDEIAALDYVYNKDILSGKWEGMMEMKPRDLPVFQEPALPAPFEVAGDGGVVVWLENDTLPQAGRSFTIGDFTKGAGQSRFFVVHPRSQTLVNWSVVDKPDFVHIERISPGMLYEARFKVSLDESDASSGTFSVKINDEAYLFSFQVKGGGNYSKYMEKDSMIALDAADYTNSADLEVIEGLGHSGRAIKLPPTTRVNANSPHLEYSIHTESSGEAYLKIGTIFRHPALYQGDLRYAVVIDDQEPHIVSVRADFLSDKWSKCVLRNQMLTVLEADIAKPGKHRIKIYALDEELIFDQVMLDFDRERKHYIIPSKAPELHRHVNR